jgi:hydrogenase expression/formation protein HypD
LNFNPTQNTIKEVLNDIKEKAEKLGNVKLMEVCGSHTQAIEQNGIRSLMPENISLFSGPGCPVCVTTTTEIDEAIEIAKKGVTVTSFGDLIRVKGSKESLLDRKAKGDDIRVVYSVFESLEIAKQKEIVHIGIGFETTAPGTAQAILEAKKKGVENFSVLSFHKYFVTAMDALLESGEITFDGLISPGHVSTITGSNAFEFLSDKHDIPQVISGFEAFDVLVSISMLLEMIGKNEKTTKNEYIRSVTKQGNIKAIKALKEVFKPCDASWRGIGLIKNSGMKIKFKEFDAKEKYNIKTKNEYSMPKGCRCGEVVKGQIHSEECPLFGNCNPENPIGPCMVSVEGSCYNVYKSRSADSWKHHTLKRS